MRLIPVSEAKDVGIHPDASAMVIVSLLLTQIIFKHPNLLVQANRATIFDFSTLFIYNNRGVGTKCSVQENVRVL